MVTKEVNSEWTIVNVPRVFIVGGMLCLNDVFNSQFTIHH